MSAVPPPAPDVREPFPDVPAAGGIETGSVPTVPHSVTGLEIRQSTDRSSVLNAAISRLGLTAFRTTNRGKTKRNVSPSYATDCGQEAAVSMFSIDKSIIATLIRRETKPRSSGGSNSQASHTVSGSQWQPKAGPVMFQGVDLNSLGCQRYCSESPPLPALSAQGSIRLLPGLHLPLEVFEAQFGTTAWTIFAYLTVPAIGYHAIGAICILDLMFFDRDRWWTEPVPRFLITAAGLEIVVVLQTVSMLLAAIADSVPAHADIYQVLMSVDVPSLSYAVFIHRIAPLIDTAAAAALFIYDPIQWWLSDSHAGTALLLGLLYAMLVQLEVHARYPVSGPEATSKRRSTQRRVHALLLWLLHMNLILGLCSTYRTYVTVRWLTLFQVACHILYIGWWRAFMSNSMDDIIDNSDWLLAFIFLKLPAVFAAGMGFWCLGPYSEDWVPEDACSAANWVVHGVSMVADITVLGFLVLLMFRLTPLGTMVVPLDARPDSLNGSKALSAPSALTSFALRNWSSQTPQPKEGGSSSLPQKSLRSADLIGDPPQVRSLILWQPRVGVPDSGGVSRRISNIETGSSVAGSSGMTNSSAKPFHGSRGPGQQVMCAQADMQKSRSHRHSTVTFLDQVDSTAAQEQARNLESSMDVHKHRSR